MSLDPYTGLDPAAPATTLYKTVTYVYVPPPPAPPPVLTPPPSGTSYSGSSGTSSMTYYINDQPVTYSEFVAAGGGSFF
jgi:hypothetical protein